MKIAYITTYDAGDFRNWSGTGTFIAKSLESQGNELDYIGNLKTKKSIEHKLKSLYYFRFLNKGYFPDRTFNIAHDYSQQVEKCLSSSAELIFSPGTIPIAYLDTKKPKVFYTDATFAGMLDFYESFSNLSQETINDGNKLEQMAIDSCNLCIYASDWAAGSAIEHYKTDPEKIKVVPFGANIECNRTLSDIREILKHRSRAKCQLLFLGVDWERKGGNMALEIAKQLNQNGLETILHIVGINSAPVDPLPDFVMFHGYVSKSSKEGRDILDQLFQQSHFLILPSLAEAYGIVFCEANSFGVPCITTDVGGISTIIKDDINGKKFSIMTGAKEYANYIQFLFYDYSKYEQISFSSFNEYETRLNWNTSGKSLMKLIKEL